jgi:PAS domain S-box-containing protein
MLSIILISFSCLLFVTPENFHLPALLISVSLSMIFCMGIAFFIARKLTHPLRELAQCAEKIEGGDFSNPISTSSAGEFRLLADAFNKMVTTLQEREATIRAKNLDLEVLNRSLHELNEQLERKVSERTSAVLTQKGRLEAVLSGMVEGVLVTGPDNRVTLVNPAAQKILDLLPHRVIGQRLEHLCDRSGFCELVQHIREMQKEGSLADGREEEIEAKGKKLRVHLAALHHPERDFAGVVMSIRDVTLEDEVDRMKTDFISTVSHELKTPLTSIKGSLQVILRRRDTLTETEQDLLDICLRNTERLIRLIRDILDLSKIESGRIEFNFKPGSINRLASDAVEEIRNYSQSHSVSIVLDLPNDLPLVYCEHDRLFQVITNLLSNAVKFSPSGEIVTVSAEPEGEFLAVSVSDRGKTIKKSERDKLFKRFQQLNTPETREHSGTGLGLAICREIIERHHGKLYYRPGAGGGNVFTFTVPTYGEYHEKREDSNS